MSLTLTVRQSESSPHLANICKQSIYADGKLVSQVVQILYLWFFKFLANKAYKMTHKDNSFDEVCPQ